MKFCFNLRTHNGDAVCARELSMLYGVMVFMCEDL